MKDLLVWLLQSGPLALTAGLFVALMLTCELGYRLGRRRADKAAGDRTAHAAASTLAATMLALMAFLLGLTINAAQTRFEARREMVVTEANAIGTAWLRGRAAPGADGVTLGALIGDYARTRLAFTQARDASAVAALDARTDAQQARIWAVAAGVARRSPTAVSAGMISAINEMFDDAQAQRFAFVSEPPNGMIDFMVFGAVLAVGAMGFEMGLGRARQVGLTSLLILMWSGVMLMTLDLSRPRLGGVNVDPRPLEWTIHSLDATPPSPP